MFNGEFRNGLDFCQWCGHMICLDTLPENITLWIDDDTGDSWCPGGFENFHKPFHEHILSDDDQRERRRELHERWNREQGV